MKINFVVTLLISTALTACAASSSSFKNTDKGQPQAMVVTANPHATKAGAEIIRAGGSAVDAAIAIEAVLSLVEPQSSGMAGGAFMVHFDNQSNKLTVYDGRETAPASATKELFLDDSGQPMGFIQAKVSGISTGVPGMLSMLQLAHQDHGLLGWGNHFAYAKRLASEGFEVSPRLYGMIQRFGKYLPTTADQGQINAYHYFHTEAGEPLPVGHLLKNAAYAKTLETIERDPSQFYHGSIAKEIVATAQQAPRASGITMDDMGAYSAKRRTALCLPFKNKSLCGPPPPSSWLAVGMTMGILEKAHVFSEEGVQDPKNWAIFGEAQRLAYADRDKFVADGDAVIVPVTGMLNSDYLALRASEISINSAVENIQHGDPWAFNNTMSEETGKDATLDIAGTSHFVVVDKQGDVVSMTATVESVFGSTRMAGGMFLNNQLTDFSFRYQDDEGLPIANAVAPHKRPRSSMSPTIVLDDQGGFLMATGSPGGNSIIAYTAKTLVGVLEWKLTPQQAVGLPNLVARGDLVRIERDRATPELIKGLRDYGFKVKESAGENSGLSVVFKHADGELEGGVDSRREGVVEAIY
jgi:gamma-glutamyltranspeptidase/glutathione hydrolase